ncbi:MAG: hypothetical protein J6P60_06900 [Lachnospiraceae bacterium]|nr:hypothetical protein [Lachnospiraceae bacterium]
MGVRDQNHYDVVGTTDHYLRNRILGYVFATVIAAVCACVIFAWLGINSGVRGAMREAKDVRIAMKMKAVQQYGLGKALFQPAAPGGLERNMEEQILELAEADGEIVLQAWDEEHNEPAAFSYQKNRYIVLFRQDEDGSPIWDGYYALKLLEYH